MDREFLDLYNRELQLLYEQAGEFAEEYPGIAERLGGLTADRTDPMVAGLLEGTAFLAARVQLKLKHEFPEFTSNLLEQLVPNYLAPTPSTMLAKVVPPYSDAALRDGLNIERGSYLDATYRERDRLIACRYRLTAGITLWPFDLVDAEYFLSPGQIQALGVPVNSDVTSGMRLSLTCRTAPRREDEPADEQAKKQPESWFSACRATDLPVYLTGNEADSIALYEQLFANCVGIYLRFLNEFDDPVVIPLSEKSLQQIGFGETDALLPKDNRIFEGFDLLREYFMFPRKFLGFNLTGLGAVIPQIKAKSAELIFAFDEVNARLAAAVHPGMFSLFTAPAVNLFEKTTDRIAIRSNQHEYQVIPERSHYLDFEPHQVLSVHAYYAGGKEKLTVSPLYSAAMDAFSATPTLGYTIRRLPRRRTVEEKRLGNASDYTGTDVFISLVEPAGVDDEPVAELSVRALCSNRHLTEHLPVGESGADFRLLDNSVLDVVCVAGPTPPKGPVVGHHRSRSETAFTGAVTWRLINMLSLNHLGLVERGGGNNGQSLKEILSMFADLSDSAIERRIRGIRSVNGKPVIRRMRERTGTGIARGTEVTVTVDEKAFEGSGAFLLGAVLDRFFSEYAALNHFTQTVIRSVERGEIMRWPTRVGGRRLL
jgi:type VI secretion system protein ImpG